MKNAAVTAMIIPYLGQTVSGQTVSRKHKDTARMIVLTDMRTHAATGEEIGQPGTMRVEVEINTSGLVAVTAVDERKANTIARPLFYGVVAIGGPDRSGVRVRRETYPPARPDGAINLTAEQAQQIRAALATINDRGLHSGMNAKAPRREFVEASDTIAALVGASPLIKVNPPA